jgi:hypothetical protein
MPKIANKKLKNSQKFWQPDNHCHRVAVGISKYRPAGLAITHVAHFFQIVMVKRIEQILL